MPGARERRAPDPPPTPRGFGAGEAFGAHLSAPKRPGFPQLPTSPGTPHSAGVQKSVKIPKNLSRFSRFPEFQKLQKHVVAMSMDIATTSTLS